MLFTLSLIGTKDSRYPRYFGNGISGFDVRGPSSFRSWYNIRKVLLVSYIVFDSFTVGISENPSRQDDQTDDD